jgi:hypothetical protein
MLTIAWDIDDVLNELMSEWFSWWKSSHPACDLLFEEITVNPPHELLGISLNAYLKSLDQFRLERYSLLMPNTDVVKWFKKNGFRAHHIVLSAVPVDCAHESAAWVMRYFGLWIRGFHYIPSGRAEKEAPVYDQTKADFLKRTRIADIFVDDSSRNVDQAKAVGVKSYLVDRPWNQGGISLAVTLEKLTKDVS